MADWNSIEWAVDCLKTRVDSWDRERRDADPCWEGYEQRGTKEKDGRTVPNCVKSDASSTAIARDGKSALSQLNYLAERYAELLEDEGNSAANGVLLRNKNDIQRWMKAAGLAGMTTPKVFDQNRMWK